MNMFDNLEIEMNEPDGWETNIVLERSASGEVFEVIADDDTEEDDDDASDN